MRTKWLAVGLVFAATAWPLAGQETGPGGEIILSESKFPDGRAANAPLDNSETVRNWDSPPGSGIGCCVVASSVAAANYLGLSEVGSEIKRQSYTDRGGHFPEKIDRQWAKVKAKFPDFGYTQWWDGDEDKLLKWSESGRPVAVTFAYGLRYGNGRQKISHMVTLLHLDPPSADLQKPSWAMIVDNNFEKERSAMPRAEFLRRWKANSGGWGLVITSGKPKRPNLPVKPNAPDMGGGSDWESWLVLGFFAVGGGLLLVASARRRRA